MPKVSVVVATYKRKEALQKAIESICAQSYSDVEILVVDDNANDEWNNVAEEIAKKFDNRVVYIRNERNLGSAQTRNRGLEAATGKYGTFLDDDDEYLPQKIEKQVGFMEENQLDFSVTDLGLYYEDGSLCERRSRSYLKDATYEQLLPLHLIHHIAGTDTMMFRTEYLRAFGGFGTVDMGDEFYLMAKAIEQGGRFGYLPECDIRAVVHTKGEGLSIGQTKIEGEHQVYSFVRSYFQLFSAKEKRYVKMRHHAVLAFAYWRQKQLIRFFLSGVHSVLCSPVACLKLLKNNKKQPAIEQPIVMAGTEEKQESFAQA